MKKFVLSICLMFLLSSIAFCSEVEIDLNALALDIQQVDYFLKKVKSENSGKAELDLAMLQEEAGVRKFKNDVANIEEVENLSSVIENVATFALKIDKESDKKAVLKIIPVLKEKLTMAKASGSESAEDMLAELDDISLTVEEMIFGISLPGNLPGVSLPGMNLPGMSTNIPAPNFYITLDIPERSCVVSLVDNKKERRVNFFKQILKNHSGKVESENSYKRDKLNYHNFYVFGEEHFVKALVKKFGAKLSNGRFKAIVEFQVGSFFSKKKIEMEISPKGKIEASAAYLRSNLTDHPFEFLKNYNLAKFKELAKVKKIRKTNKYYIKNGKVKVWLTQPNCGKDKSIFYQECKLGNRYFPVD